MKFWDPSSRQKASEQQPKITKGTDGMPTLHPKPPPNVKSRRRPEPVPESWANCTTSRDSRESHAVRRIKEIISKTQRHLSSGQRHLPAVSSSDENQNS